jgi:hypothetical protein
MDTKMAYTLRQTSPATQILTPKSDSTLPSYAITLRATGGFMNKKPHMAITRQHDGMNYRCAEVRFENYGSGTSILYKDSGVSQILALESSLDQRYECLIQGRSHRWYRLGSSRNVLELTSDIGDCIALFTYGSEVALTTGARTGNKKHVKDKDIGELHIHGDGNGGVSAVEQVICSALAVIERAKRRAANVGRQGSAYKQGASCGITCNAYGGGL